MKYTSIDSTNAPGAVRPAGSKYAPIEPTTTPAVSSYSKRYVPIDEGPAPIQPVTQAQAVEQKPVKQGFLSKIGNKVASAISRPDESELGTDKKKNTLKYLPSSIVESLPFGLGEVFKQIHDIEQYEPETMNYFDNKDLTKNLPKSTLETAKGFVKAPIAGALDVAGITGKKIKVNIPGLGEVSNAQFKTAERVANGEDPVQVALEEGSTAILDTLFFASLASKPFVGRPTTTAKGRVPAEIYEKTPGASQGLKPKSFRLYEQKVTSSKLTPEFIEKAQSQGVSFGPRFNPERPTYFKMSYEPKTNSFVGEIVQIKPSWVSIIANKFKGDITKAPTQAIEVISAPKEVKALDIEKASKSPIVEQKAPETTIAPSPEVKAPEIAKTTQEMAPKKYISIDSEKIEKGALKGVPRYDTQGNFLGNVGDEQIQPKPEKVDIKTDISTENGDLIKKAEIIYNRGALNPMKQGILRDEIKKAKNGESNELGEYVSKFEDTLNKGDLEYEKNKQIENETFIRNAKFELKNKNKSDIEIEIKKLNKDRQILLEKTAKSKENVKNISQAVSTEKNLEANGKRIVFLEDILNRFDELKTVEKIQTNPENVTKLHDELKTVYKKYPEAETEMNKILVELELAEPGKRIFDYSGIGTEVTGVKSTFPEWIPEGLRTKKSLDALREVIKSIETISYPSRSNAVGKRLLVNEMLSVLDSRLGIDTTEIREDILKEYGEIKTSDNKLSGESGQRSRRGEPTGERAKIEAKKKEEKDNEIARLKQEIEEKEDFSGKLSEIDIEERKAKLAKLEGKIQQENLKVSNDLSGKIAKSIEEVPALLKKYRDDNFETFHQIYTDENGIILEHIKLTSEHEGRVFLTKKEGRDDIKERVERLKAKNIYLLHNHPSGNIEPSLQDEWTLNTMTKANPIIKGGIVIAKNSKKVTYMESFVSKDGFRDIKIYEKPLIEKDVTSETKLELAPDFIKETKALKKDVEKGEKIGKKVIQKKSTELPNGPSGSDNADVGVFIEGNPVELGNMDKIRPIEFPELVDIARELSKNPPRIKKLPEHKGGYFRGADQSITINADAFKNPEQAAKILAHEIGHLIDYLPEGTLARGNLIGRLKTLQGFMAETFGEEGEKFPDARKNQIRNKITKEVLSENGLKLGDMFGDKLSKERKSSIQAEIRTRMKKELDQILNDEGYLKNKDIQKELMDASMYWRPLQKKEIVFDENNEMVIDEETGKPKIEIKNIPLEQFSKSFQAYRKSSKELYADAISMLFNSPGTLEKMAPIFYKEFFAGLDQKPAVFNAYFELQDLLGMGDRNALLERRRAGVKGMFDKGDMKAAEIQRVRLAQAEARRKDVIFNFKFNVIDKNYALIDRVNKLQKEGKSISEDENPIYYLEERNYLGGKIKAFMEKKIQPVHKKLIDNDISWNDFGEALFYDRIRAGDRSDVANPRGITPKVAEELLQKQFEDMGEEKAKILVDSMEEFRSALKEVAEEAFQEGLYKAELHDTMMENKAYSTFQVLDHMEEGMTSKIHQSIGTLKDISNPADASLLKTFSTIRAIERNKVTRSVVEFLQKNFKEDILDAKTIQTPKGKIPQESKLPGQELIAYMKEGKRVGFYVDRYIRDSVENNTIGHTIQILRTMNSSLFRPLFITYNPGFQAFNLVRDFTRFWKNTPGMTLIKAIKRYREAMPVAKARAWGIKDNNSWGAEILSKMEGDQILSITYNQMTDSADVEDSQIETILRDSGIESFQPAVKYKALQPFVKVLDFLKNMGDYIETLPKVAGFLEFSKGGEVEISKEQESFIRKNIGSPDFLAGGYWKPITNEVFLFSNSITQGIRSDINVATDPKTRSGYWWKTAKANLLPKIFMYLATIGLFGETVKEIMEKASEYDKTNYIIIPLGIDGNGKAVYFRLPQDETGRLIGGLSWKIINSQSNKQNIGKDMLDIVSFTGGQLPSPSPVITTGTATGQFITGQNPYDWFRNREVLTDDQMKAGGMYAVKPFLGWLFNQAGGGVFYQFTQTAPRDKSTTEKLFNLPLVGNIAGRFVKVSDYGIGEEFNQIKAEVQKDQAIRRLDENAVINDYIKDSQKNMDDKSIDELVQKNKAKIITEVLGHAPQTEEELTRAKNIEKKYKIGLQRGESDPYINALISAVTNDEKIALIQEYKKTLSKQDFNKIMLTSLKYKIVSPEAFIKSKPATNEKK